MMNRCKDENFGVNRGACTNSCTDYITRAILTLKQLPGADGKHVGNFERDYVGRVYIMGAQKALKFYVTHSDARVYSDCGEPCVEGVYSIVAEMIALAVPEVCRNEFLAECWKSGVETRFVFNISTDGVTLQSDTPSLAGSGRDSVIV